MNNVQKMNDILLQNVGDLRPGEYIKQRPISISSTTRPVRCKTRT